MSNPESQVALIDSSLFPALSNQEDAMEIMNANIGEGESIGFSDLVRIKMPSGETYSFQVPNIMTGGSDALTEVSGIVVHWHSQRAFWPKSISEGGDPMPLCYSHDGVEGKGMFDVGPDDELIELDEAAEPIIRQCSTCPMSQYGSAPDGSRQWCKAMRRLYLIRENEILPTIITMPPSSIKPCKTFFSQLTSRAIPYYFAKIAIGLEPASAEKVGDKGKVQKIKYMKATFRVTALFDNEQKEQMKAFRKFILPFLNSFSENEVPVATEAEAE